MKSLTTNQVANLRKNMTKEERQLWAYLRAKRLQGYKFRRQHLIHPFIVDFICIEKKLIIELDGSQHGEQQVYDESRSKILREKGYRILRFWNNEIKNMEEVLTTILHELERGF